MPPKNGNPSDPEDENLSKLKQKWPEKGMEALYTIMSTQYTKDGDEVYKWSDNTVGPVTPGGNEGAKEEDINLPHASCSGSSTSSASGQISTQQSDRIKETKNINLPHSSSYGSSTACASGQLASKQNDSNKENKNINLPHSSSYGSSTACASGQLAAQQSDRIKNVKDINLKNSSSNKPSSLCTIDHKVGKENGNKKTTKRTKNDRISQKEKSPIKPKLPVLKHTKISSNADETRPSCSQSVPINYSENKNYQNRKKPITQDKAENLTTQQSDCFMETKNMNLPNPEPKTPSSLCTIDHQVDKKDEKSMATKKTKNDYIIIKEKSPIKPKIPALKHLKSITESNKLRSNTDEARPSCSQSAPINYSDDKNYQMCKKPITQVKNEDKATEKVEDLTPIKSVKFVSNSVQNVPPKVHTQTTEDLTKKREKLQQKLKTCERQDEFLNRQEEKVLSSDKGKSTGICGNIEVQATDKSVKNTDKKSSITCDNKKDLRKVFIEDESIKFNIHVTKGYQVVCKSRTRPVTDLVDVKSGSSTLEGHTIETPEDLKTDSENYRKTTSNSKFDSNSISEFPNGNFQFVNDQATVVADTNTLIGLEQYNETTNDTNSTSSTVTEFPKERDSSRITSVQENLQGVLQHKLMDTCERQESFLNREEEKLLSSDEGKGTGISGNIEVLATDVSVKNRDKEGSITCDYENDSKIFIEDGSIKITIEVTEGYHVVCNSRTRPVSDLVNVKSSPGTLECRIIETPEEDIKTDSETVVKRLVI